MRRRATLWVPRAAVMGAIPVAAVHEFLTRRGWVQQPSARPTCRYYEHPGRRAGDGSRSACYVPASDHFDDYPLRVLQFVEDQALFEELDPWDVLAELQGGPVAQPVPAPVPA